MTKVIEDTFDEILAKCVTADGKGTDNMTAILVSFKDNTKSQQQQDLKLKYIK